MENAVQSQLDLAGVESSPRGVAESLVDYQEGDEHVVAQENADAVHTHVFVPRSCLPLHQLLILPHPRPLAQRGKIEILQLGPVTKSSRQRKPRLHEELRFPPRSNLGVFPLVEQAAKRVRHVPGRRQPITLAEVYVA